MDIHKREHRRFRSEVLNDLRRLKTAELIINSESESVILAWSALTILAERGFPVDGSHQEWVGHCHPYLAAPCDNEGLIALHEGPKDETMKE
jgi:hypothetical protein